MKMRIPLFRIYWDEDDIKSVNEVIKSGENWCIGESIKIFEEMIKEYLGVKYCVTFNSGGSALHATMIAYGFKPGDEIIVPSFTFIATAYAPLYVGAKPVFVDIEEETLGLDPDDILNRINNNTKAIIPIHYGGMPCKIKEIKEIAEDHNLILIEDAAEAFGAKVWGELVGTFGDASIFSFCQNKVFTTSEGGCVVTDNKEIYEKLKLISSYGRTNNKDYFRSIDNIDYITLGYNWRLSTILAALGVSQLRKIDKLIRLRREKAYYLNENLKRIKGIKIPIEPNGYFSVFQLYTIRVLEGRNARDGLIKFLRKKGISSKIYFDPVHKYTIFKKIGYDKVNLPITEKISSEVLSLPIYPSMMEKELEYIANSISEFFEEGQDVK